MTPTQARSDELRSAARRGVRTASIAVFVLVLAVVFIYPVSMIVLGAVKPGLPTGDAPISLDAFVAVFTEPETAITFLNSVILIVVCGTFSTLIGGLFAWVNANTNVPLRPLITPAMITMIFLPPLFYTFGWLMLANEQNGLLNQLFEALGVGVILDIQSWGGMLFAMSIGFSPFTYLLLLGAFRNRDQSLDEAAQISGASPLRAFFTVTLPSVGPALAGTATLVLVLLFQSFESPQLLGKPDGIYVFSTRIYHYVNNFTPGKYSEAFSLALVMVLFVVLLFALQRFILRGRSFSTLTGKSSKRDPIQLGGIRWVFSGLIVLFIIVNLVLPLGAVVLGSLQPLFGVWGQLSLANYEYVLRDPALSSSLTLTLQMAIPGGLLAMSVALLTTYVTMRQRGFIRSYTSFAVWIPWALPGIVTALAYLWTILTLPGAAALYATTTFVTLVVVIATIPLCVRLAEGALAQLAPELEEAGRVSGAGPIRVLVTVILRLLLPSFLAGWFLSAVFISGNLAVPVLLAPPGLQPVSVTAYQLSLAGETAAGAALFVMIMLGAVTVLIISGILRYVGTRVGRRRSTKPAATAAMFAAHERIG